METRLPFDPNTNPNTNPNIPIEGFLHLNTAGQWLYKGEPITHPGLVQILESNYGRDSAGRYVVSLKLPGGIQKVAVTFDDSPYFIKNIQNQTPKKPITLLNDTTHEPLESLSISMGLNGSTYAIVKDGQWAKFTRKAELLLSPFVDERKGKLGLSLHGTWIPIGTREDR